MLRRLLLVPLLAGALLLPLPTARADTWAGADASGDVQAYDHDPEPAPCGTATEEVRPHETATDITRLRVTHRRHGVRVVVGFRDLPRTGRHATDLFLRTPRTTWELNVSRDRTDGKTEVYLAKAPDYEAAAEDADECGAFIVSVSSRDCPDLQAGVDPRRDRVVATVPRACLRSPRWVRAAATAHDYGDGGPMLHDDWVPVGRPDNGQVIGPMTPRVRRDSSS